MDDPHAVCARCGRTERDAPADWTLQAEDGRRTWLCAACTREHLRSIEGKLDDRWW